MLDLDNFRWVPYKRHSNSKKEKFVVELIEKDMYFFCKKYENEIIASNQLLIDKIPPKDNCIYSVETDSWHPVFGANADGTINYRPDSLDDLKKIFWKPEDFPPSRYHLFDFEKDSWVLPSKKFFSTKHEKKRRLEICSTCNFFSEKKICKKCGCFMPIKTSFKMFHCPISKW